MPFAILDDVKLYYEAYGEGKPIVFVHHLAGSYKSWKFISYQFAKDYKVIVYDLRGHGRSSVLPMPYLIEDHSKDLKGLLEYLEVRDPIVVGHSIGTLIALDFSLKNSPEKLVLIGALYKAPDQEPYRRYVSIATNFGMEALANYRRMQKEFSPTLTENPQAWNSLLEVYRENTPLGYKMAVEGLLSARDYGEDLQRIDVPTLIVYGSNDGLIKNLNVMQKIPKHVTKTIEGYGHFLNFEEPQWLTKVITEFL
ncbi:MAG: alpha/beta hydrolase [Candidatus Aramenus sp.]|nr:alpha/beta hydrolase [Candidatus Aramenus sp.]